MTKKYTVFSLGEEVEVINTRNHVFITGTKVKVIDIGGFVLCVNSIGVEQYVKAHQIKHIKPTINKDELRKHLEAVDTLWQKTPGSLSVSINKYLETL